MSKPVEDGQISFVDPRSDPFPLDQVETLRQPGVLLRWELPLGRDEEDVIYGRLWPTHHVHTHVTRYSVKSITCSALGSQDDGYLLMLRP